MRILEALKSKPRNTNQLARMLKMDYKTVKYHLNVLKKYKIVTCSEDYGAPYFLSKDLTRLLEINLLLQAPKQRYTVNY